MRLRRIVRIGAGRDNVEKRNIVRDIGSGIVPRNVHEVRPALRIVPPCPSCIIPDNLKLGSFPVAHLFGEVPVRDIRVSNDELDVVRNLRFAPFRRHVCRVVVG